MTIWERVQDAEPHSQGATWLDVMVPESDPGYEEAVSDLVDFYKSWDVINAPWQEKEELKVLRQLAYRTANAVFLLADGEAETKDEDFIQAIHSLGAALDQAGVKWTSGRS